MRTYWPILAVCFLVACAAQAPQDNYSAQIHSATRSHDFARLQYLLEHPPASPPSTPVSAMKPTGNLFWDTLHLEQAGDSAFAAKNYPEMITAYSSIDANSAAIMAASTPGPQARDTPAYLLARSQRKLGIYDETVARDDAAAFQAYSKAISVMNAIGLEDPNTTNRLAFFYANGRGGAPKDAKKARAMFVSADGDRYPYVDLTDFAMLPRSQADVTPELLAKLKVLTDQRDAVMAELASRRIEAYLQQWHREHPNYHYSGYGSEPQTETHCWQNALPVPCFLVR